MAAAEPLRWWTLLEPFSTWGSRSALRHLKDLEYVICSAILWRIKKIVAWVMTLLVWSEVRDASKEIKCIFEEKPLMFSPSPTPTPKENN